MKKLGILGGMGPAASAEFVSRLIQQTPAICDQDHIPFVLWNEPRIPDRSTSMQSGDNLPLSWLQDGVRGLMNAGCSYIVITCNSAHFWYSQLSEISVPILHIVDSVAEELKSLNLSGKKIGILGTQGTIQSGLYQHHLNRQGWECIVPCKEEMAGLVTPAIHLIKANKFREPQMLLSRAMHSLIDRGAQAIVLGCTELPLVIRTSIEEGIPIVNSIDSLVKAVITKHTSQ
jgi:aspartate racemase